MVLLIDNFDSFSHILADYLRQLGLELEIVRNDISIEELKTHDYDALILSPGPGTPSTSGQLMEILAYFSDKIPVLGICLGHQAIGEFFGARLQKGKNPVHGKVHTIHQTGNHRLLKSLPDSFMVTRYHSLVLSELPECLEVILETESSEIMAFVHKELPIMGIQYHPEAHLTEFGKEIIQHWLDHSKTFDKNLLLEGTANY
ncbi:anthranilate synthase component II [Arthrospiribacter ruber]|uniref:Aminodeoxychorismate/anthranilate synthase component II n=1 Tax=Arthrospiribacter ruber TaxID=2487934 RepID=A0A951MAD5_9BACT|nr:aminodeoxychorismate/anthranilate synthase component II [Arthrospiribacter ruber]MBW3467876.1 aminodeoxychorismate/anthranilate synthase component II [Arthrospiribacter ruber]